jgi:hypothetical protein
MLPTNRQFLILIGQFFLNSSPLKPLGQMNRNLVGTIYGRSSISGFRREDFLEINQSETRIACGGHVC